MNIRWKKKDGAECAFVGKIHVATVIYTSLRDHNAYEYTMLLPGIAYASGRRGTVEDAKARAEELIKTWFIATENK